MPRWSWVCNKCDYEEDRLVPLRLRDEPYDCPKCGKITARQFSRESALNFLPFEAHYDEGLGCDVHTRREKKMIMNALNVHEAGDAKGGARNFDKHAPEHVKPTAVRGEPFLDRRLAKEESTPIGTVGKDGKTKWSKSTELKSL